MEFIKFSRESIFCRCERAACQLAIVPATSWHGEAPVILRRTHLPAIVTTLSN